MPTEVHLRKLIQEYSGKGYMLSPQVLPVDWIDDLLERYMGLVGEVTGRPFTDPHGADLAAFYDQHRDVESAIYDKIRRPEKPMVVNVTSHPSENCFCDL